MIIVVIIFASCRNFHVLKNLVSDTHDISFAEKFTGMSKNKNSTKSKPKKQKKVKNPDEVISKINEDTIILKGIASRFGKDKSNSKLK